MTSVPNHPPRSNGNNSGFIALAALLILFVSSCDALKPAVNPNPSPRVKNDDGRELDPVQSRRVYDPATGTYVYVDNAPTDRMDTVRWTLVPEDRNPPITEDGSATYTPPPGTVTPGTVDPGTPGAGEAPVSQTGTTPSGSRLLSAYNVAFALPFLTDRYLGSEDKVDENSAWALHFYSGARMALDELRGSAGASFNVNVQDTRAKPETARLLTAAPEFNAAHLVVGPYLKANVTTMTEAVRGRETVLISPYSASTGVTTNNPNYVQVNPTLETHMRSLIKHAYRTQNPERIVLVTGTDPGQQARLGYLHDEYKVLTGGADVAPLEELSLDLNDATVELARYLGGRRKTVFIVPIYEDESFVANFLRLLYTRTRDDFGRGVVVYGLPQWQDYTRINFDYYEGTNVHISSSVYVDPLDPAVRAFRRNFYERFAVLPQDEAYVGYDVTRYFLRMTAEHGTRFQYALEANPEDLLHTKFRFEPVAVVPAGASNFERATLDRFENKFVNILRFKDYAFKRVN